MATIRDIIERRVNSTGVSEPIVVHRGHDRVVVELPGATDARRSSGSSGPTGQLTSSRSRRDLRHPATTGGATGVIEGQPLPGDPIRPLFTGDQLDAANPATDQTGGRAVGVHPRRRAVDCSPTTRPRHVGEFFAIVLDGTVISAPSIESAITGGPARSRGQRLDAVPR